ncbi:MAG: hypothetical protein Q7J15_06120 [Candidatus Desulfaltia sp.]|nr:hypothetical protein [Candidatus Desulfaltia sp.]
METTTPKEKHIWKQKLAFKEDYPEAQACLLYRGKERLKIKNILCLPCEEFLMNLKPDKPIEFDLKT